MLRRQIASLIAATMSVSTLFCAFSLGVAGPQEKAKSQPPAGEATKEQMTEVVRPSIREAKKREGEISKLIAEYDLKPHLSTSIPDDPPPHEGAMIGFPHLVEPPDLMIVEVLDALPGRPISGERLVGTDGTISLGFYGDVYVRGMTLAQVKVAIIKHLRKYLSDIVLGLETPEVEAQLERPPIPELPAGAGNPFQQDEKPKVNLQPRSSSSRTPSIPQTRGVRSVSRQGSGNRAFRSPNRSRIVHVSSQDQDAPAPAPQSIKVPVGGQGKVTITIELDGQNGPKVENPQPGALPQVGPSSLEGDDNGWKVVPPAESGAVFVDITAYNSKNYYVLGDVLITGKLPWTGNETVLDALQFAGGLTASAEAKDIRLVRPGRGGKPAKIYKVDLAAIQEKGDVVSNYQIFPNDRLIVGRNEVVKKTVAMDRLAAPLSTATASIQSIANMFRAVQLVDPANSGKIMKELVDFWAKEASRKDDLKFDDETLRDALLQKLKSTSTPKP